MFRLPATLPAVYVSLPGVGAITQDVDAGGYDVLIGGHGFRLANDPQNPYSRGTEQTTAHRYDSSLEPGEQSLAQLPWIKAQSTFHAGAGQRNLEQGFTAFQYQQEQVEHARFDNCLGVDPWTPGILRRLPDCHFYSFGFSSAQTVTASVAGVDYAIVGGTHSLEQLVWASGPDAAPTATSIDLTPALYGGASNVTVASLATDGSNYYALLQLTADGSAAGVRTYVVSGSVASTAAPTALYHGPASSTQLPGVVGWQKARLVGALGNAIYELSTTAANAALPTANYTHPASGWTWSALAESPTAILAAGAVGNQPNILSFALDTSGGFPVLTGGNVLAVLPPGEIVYSLVTMNGAFLGIGTALGVRVGTFDTYTGALKYGPLSVTTTAPVLSMTGRDRFIYATYTNQQADGKTGLVALDLTMEIDAGGRNAYAPSLRPPTSAPTGLGAVTAVGLLPSSNRLMFMTAEGIHVEGNGPGSDGAAWLRTSRIRYDTTEPKLFKLGRITGTLDVGDIQITGIAPFQSDVNLGTFGHIANGDPGSFRLPSGLHEWIQLQFTLIGSSAELHSYQVKALPAPGRQHIIQFTVNCFSDEVDRNGYPVTDPESPFQRLLNVQLLEEIGDEIRFVEFTEQGSRAQLVVIDQLVYQQSDRPMQQNGFGGTITFKLRATEQ